MNRIGVFLVTGLLCACQPAGLRAPAVGVAGAEPVDAADDAMAWVLPGAYSEFTTRADLESRFGAANVELVESREDDGRISRGLVLFPHDPRRRAHVAFHDDENLALLRSIEVRDAGSQWRGKHGVRIGMSLAELQRINGKPFYLSGFDAEGRGYARDQWSPALDDDDRALGALDVDGDDRLYFGVDFALRTQGGDTDWPRDEHLSSDDPRWPRLGESVVVVAFSAWSSLDDEWQ